MKKLTRRIFQALGYDIIKVAPPRRTVHTGELKFYKTATGNYYLPAGAEADLVADTMIHNRIFEKEVVDLASKYIKKGTAVLDIGANFGQMTMLFSEMVGENGKVYCFDADDFVYEILKKNIAANNRQNIVPNYGAVHNEDGVELFFPTQDFVEFQTYGSYGIDYTATKGRKVKSLTIDSLGIKEPISFMKIDIQGGDLQAMQGAVETIQKNRMPIIFEYEYHFEEKFKLNFQEYVDFVAGINYKFENVINGHNFLILPK
jgi:FkbM family methyltransferase